MQPRSQASKHRLIQTTHLIPILIFALAITARILPGPRTIDDSYITYRYSRNILAGNGFVYNPGERVLGTTTPFYTLLLTTVGSISGGETAPFPEISLVINALADGITCLLLFWLGRYLGSEYAAIGAALVWAVAPFSVTFAIGGLETSIYVLLLVSTICAHVGGRHILAAFIAALMLLTRPDALILLGPLGLDRIWQIYRNPDQRPSLRKLSLEALAFILPSIVWIMFSTIYFGSPIPHSITAKSSAYLLPENSALIRLLQHYFTIFLGHFTFGNAWIAVGMVLYPFLYLIGSFKAFEESPHSWPFLAYPWLYLVTFAIPNPLIFRWYLTPPLPALMLVVLIGLERLMLTIAGIVTRWRRRPKPLQDQRQKYSKSSRILLIFITIIVPFTLTMRGWQLHPDHGLTSPAPSMAWYLLELKYRQAADILNSEFHTPPEDITLAAGDVGVLGYFTKARILDTVGLNSPQSTKYYPLPEQYHVNAYAISTDLILEEKPDYLVFLEVYARNTLLADEHFSKEYSLIYQIPTDIYDSEGMLIYTRVSEP